MVRRFLMGATAAALIAAFFLSLPQPDAPQPQYWPDQPGNSFVLRGVRVFDGERLHERRDVLVIDGIVAVFSAKAAAPAGTPEFAADGHTLLPAFIDAHTHNFGSSREEALRFGVGVQIDMFTSVELLPAARRQRAGLDRVAEADMWSAGTLVTAPGGHGSQYGLAIPTLASAEQAAAFVADRAAEGSDFIKLVVEGGHGWGGSLPTLDQAAVAAVAEAARAHGLQTVAHAGAGEEARRALEGGADALAHVFGDVVAGEDLVALIRERAAFVVPTLAVLESVAGRANGLVEDPRVAPWLAPTQLDTLGRRFPGPARPQVLANGLANTGLLYQAGVPILAGSDAPNPGTAHGAGLHRELELLLEAGLPASAVLAAATSLPARHFGLADRGRIAPGMRADLVLVAGDPLADITATRQIAAVWKNGFQVPRHRQDAAEPAPALPGDRTALGAFERGPDGWLATTDEIQGGRSAVTVEGGGGLLRVAAEVRSGAPWPWAGAMRMLADQPWEPVDLSGFEALVLRLRGDGPLQVLFFSGANPQAVPASVAVSPAQTWQETTIALAEAPGLDRSRVRAVGVVAGPAPGTASFELSAAVLR